MISNLAENIRTFRKQRRLTQEQLAEVMGVTTGAVHKWEIGASVPELGMIMELADFFDVSMDVLTGYRMKDNRIEALKKRLSEYCRTMDPAAIGEAEKALKKYPNSFEIVDGCASVFLVYSIGSEKKDMARRALELLYRALELLPGNTDPWCNEVTVYGQIADAYLLLGETEKALDIMKVHNICGLFSGNIGVWLSVYQKRYDESETYLSEALIGSVNDILNAASGFYSVFCARKDYDSALEILDMAKLIIDRTVKKSRTGFFSKSEAMLLTMLANVHLIKGNTAEAQKLLRESVSITRRFDQTPDYSLGSVRFALDTGETSLHDIMGKTAADSARTLLGLLENKKLTEMWEEIYANE
jgi:transcriptional regulator with XRE-family HTH domain